MKDKTEEDAIKEFFAHFYEICTSTDAFNYTMDEFYDEISEEIHEKLHKYVDTAEKR